MQIINKSKKSKCEMNAVEAAAAARKLLGMDAVEAAVAARKLLGINGGLKLGG